MNFKEYLSEGSSVKIDTSEYDRNGGDYKGNAWAFSMFADGSGAEMTHGTYKEAARWAKELFSTRNLNGKPVRKIWLLS